MTEKNNATRNADIVNVIIDKLRTGRVEFVRILNTWLCEMDIRYAGILYAISFDHGKIFVKRWRDDEAATFTDNYSRWVEGVLNGQTRDESGVLA